MIIVGKIVYPRLIMFLITLLLTSLGALLNQRSIATLIFMPLLFSYFIAIYGFKKSKTNIEFILTFFLLISSIISLTASKDPYLSLETIKKLSGVFIISYLVFELNSRYKLFSSLIIAYIISIDLLILYEIFNSNINFTEFISNKNRDIFLLNANAYSYLIFYATISLFYLYERFKNLSFLVFLLLSQYVYLVTIFSTVSRGGLIIFLLVNFIYWVFINKPKYKLISLGKVVVFLLLIFYVYLNYFVGSFISERSDSTSEIYDYSRKNLLNDGINIFIDNPFFGVGPGNFVLYSHDGGYSHISFIEVASTQGILGLIILIFLFLSPIKKFLISIFKYKVSNTFKIHGMFFLCFIIYNNFYPFYLYVDLMLFYFLIVSELNKEITTYK